MNADIKKLGDLRRRAEQFLKTNPEVTPSISTIEAQKLFRELDVNQIALVMQNEELHQALNDLKATRDAYEELFNLAPSGYLVLDCEGRILEANLTAAGLLGVEKENAVGRLFEEFVHRDSLDNWNAHQRHVLELIEKQGVELFLRRPDAEIVFVCIECLPRPESSHCLMTMVDISEHKKLEEDLQDSENWHRGIFEQAADAIVLVDPENMEILDCNEETYRRLGYSREEFTNLNFTDYEMFESREELANHLRRIMDEGPEVFETKHRTKSNDVLDIEIRAKAIEMGGRQLILGIWRDITARKQAQEALRESEGRFRRVFTNNMVPMAIWTKSGGIVEANDALLKLIGYTRAELEAGKVRWNEMTPPEQHERDTQAIREIEQKGFCTPYEKVYLHKDGHSVPIIVGGGTYDTRTGSGVLFAIDLTDRKRAEEALRESETRFRQIATATDHVFWMTQVTPERVLYVSPAFERIWGRSAEEIYADPRVWSAAIHPDDQKRVESAFGLWLSDPKQQSFNVEYRVLREDGTLRWIRDCGTPVFDESGTLLRVSGVAADITERKLAEDALRESEMELARFNCELERRVEERTAELQESEARFRTLFENAPDACCLLDLDFRIVDENKVSERLTGYPRNEFVGRNVFETGVLHPSSIALAKDNLVRLAKGATVEPTELLFVRKGGTVFPVEGTACMFPLNGVPVICAIVRDITERKQAEAERELHHRKLQLALDAAQMGWWHYDPVTHEVTHDKRVVQIFGFVGAEYSPDTLAELIHPDDRECMRAKLEAALNPAGSQLFRIEYRITRPDGEARWLEAHGRPIFEGEGAERHAIDFVGTVADITERKQMQEALEKRVLALTRPLDQPEGIAFDDLFDRQQIQRIQDEFSYATGVSSIITHPDGTPITEPSNFTELCYAIIRKTEKGCANCKKSNATIGRYYPEGPIVQHCLGCGLWSAGASIAVGGRHVANWLIGQVRDETQTDDQMRAYAREIGTDEGEFLDAFHCVPVMSRDRFEGIAQALFTLANQLSISAYQNVQQARYIAERNKAEAELRESEERYRRLFEAESDAIMIFDGETKRFIDVNDAAVKLYGYAREKFLQLTLCDITAEPEASEATIRQVLAGCLPRISHRLHRKKDGTVFPVEIAGCSFDWKERKVVCGVIRDISERVAREKELRRLASELSLAEQRERQRIAQELHDGLGQLLSSAYMRMAALKRSVVSESAIQNSEAITNILRQTLEQTRSLTFELSCPMLNELGLAAALEELCKRMTREHAIHFTFKETAAPPPLPMDQKIVLYRATRELMMNVMKHSAASQADVALGHADDNVRICVEDNGKGFDSTKAGLGFSPSGGFGLFSIGEYLRHIGGNMQIESISNGGTRVLLSIPSDS